jgi:hypothetical protein
MLRAGTATLAEIAWLAKTSHQRVSYWAKAAGIDAGKCRELYLAREWRAHTDRLTARDGALHRAPPPRRKKK